MYYRRVKNLYNPEIHAIEPFKLSRSKLENFTRCPRCFYLDRRLGVDQPSMPGFTLNIAVDFLLKKEFDIHRAAGSTHPLMQHYGIDAVPFSHPQMDEWRENFVGIQYFHRPTNFIITGAVDDVWQDRNGQLMVVDYKATSINGEIDMNDQWKQGYKRQLEIYQWLLRQLGFQVSNTGYFVYANGKKDRAAFDGKLEFDVQIISHTGDGKWVEPLIIKARECLSGQMPILNEKCDYCVYRRSAGEVEKSFSQTPAPSTSSATSSAPLNPDSIFKNSSKKSKNKKGELSGGLI